MEKVNYNGVKGVFIPCNEFEYIREAIKNNNLLLESLVNELEKEKIKGLDIYFTPWKCLFKKFFLKKNLEFYI